MSNETIPNKPLKRIDLETGRFEANGKQYTIEGQLAIERFAEFQILEKELALGISAREMFNELRQLYDLTNAQRFADIAVKLNDLIRGHQKLEEREPTVLRICALFINTPDEDRNTITDDMITTKINDWKAEGIAMADFFRVASGSVNGFAELYQKVTRIISGQERPGLAGNQ